MAEDKLFYDFSGSVQRTEASSHQHNIPDTEIYNELLAEGTTEMDTQLKPQNNANINGSMALDIGVTETTDPCMDFSNMEWFQGMYWENADPMIQDKIKDDNFRFDDSENITSESSTSALPWNAQNGGSTTCFPTSESSCNAATAYFRPDESSNLEKVTVAGLSSANALASYPEQDPIACGSILGDINANLAPAVPVIVIPEGYCMSNVPETWQNMSMASVISKSLAGTSRDDATFTMVSPSDVFNFQPTSVKRKRESESQSDFADLEPKISQTKKTKLYNEAPSDDVEREKKRKAAVKSKEHRDKTKNMMSALTQENANLHSENVMLKQQLEAYESILRQHNVRFK